MIGIRGVVALCAVVLADFASAQSSAAGSFYPIRITGRVVDPINMALPRTTASLTALGSETAKSVLTGDDGVFTFDAVSPGAYVLQFDAAGFLSRRAPLTMAATEPDVNVGPVMLHIPEITEGPLAPVKRPQKEKPVTVCENVEDPNKFSGKPVAIVGRIECGAGLMTTFVFWWKTDATNPL